MIGDRTSLGPWRFEVSFGTISLLADFVYEGARSITGPLLASLGGTALLVGVVTGTGEASALLLRLLSGPLTDQTRRLWLKDLDGLHCPGAGSDAHVVGTCALVIAERVGKAVRGPAKDTMLSRSARSAR